MELKDKNEYEVCFISDTVKVFKCGCKESKLEAPYDKDYICKTHIKKETND